MPLPKLSQLTPLQSFLLKGAALFLLWELAYALFLGPHGGLDMALTNAVAEHSVDFARLIGHEAYATADNQFVLDGRPAVHVFHPCNGLIIHVLFLGFLIAVPGDWRHKIWYGIVGVLLIHFVNVLRVYLLGINYLDSPETFDFNHKYTFALAVYAVVFGLWMVWINRFTDLNGKQPTAKQPEDAAAPNTPPAASSNPQP